MHDEFKKTPKLVTLNPVHKPLPRFIPLTKLINSPSENPITEENGKYMLWIKQTDEKIQLDKAVYRNFLLSDLLLKAKQMRELQRSYYSFEGSPRHPRRLEILANAKQAEKEFDEMLEKLHQVVQQKLF